MANRVLYGVNSTTSSGQMGPVLDADVVTGVSAIERLTSGAASAWTDANTTTITVGGGANQTTLTLGKSGQATNILGTSSHAGAADFDAGITVAASQAITGDGALTVTSGGSANLALNSSSATITTNATALTAAAALTITATSAALGLTATGANLIQLNTNGSARWNISSAGHLLCNSDNSLTIGAAGATRPATVHVGTSVVVAAALTVTGTAITGTGAVTVTATGNTLSLDGTTIETSATSITADTTLAVSSGTGAANTIEVRSGTRATGTGDATFKSGNAGTSGSTGAVYLKSGDANASVGTSGNITIDVGTGNTKGSISIGVTNASAVTVGPSANNSTLTLQSGGGTGFVKVKTNSIERWQVMADGTLAPVYDGGDPNAVDIGTDSLRPNNVKVKTKVKVGDSIDYTGSGITGSTPLSGAGQSIAIQPGTGASGSAGGNLTLQAGTGGSGAAGGNWIAKAGSGTTGGTIQLWTGASSTERWDINADGHLLAYTTNSVDIGASADNQPRTVYAATSVVTPLVKRASDGNGVTIGEAGSGASTGSAPKMISMTTTQRGYLTPTNGMVVYNSSVNELQGYINSTWLSLAGSGIDAHMYGFLYPQQTSIAFNDGTYQFTLTDLGSGWSYYRAGIKYTISGNKTATLAGSPPTANTYYIYIDATDGTLTASTSAWTLQDTKVPVAIILWNNANTPKYWMADERHTVRMLRRDHFYHHTTHGTQYTSGGVPGDYTITPSSPVDDDNTFSITETVIQDEDLLHTLSALADPDGATLIYPVFYRTGASTWTWAYSEEPFRYTAAGYIQYDNAGTMTQGAHARWYNTYLLYTNMSGDARYIIVHGRSQFTSLATARAESPGSFSWDGLPIAENVIAYQFTWETSNSYSTKGKCRLAAAPARLNIALTSAAVGTVTPPHNSLSGLQGGTTGEFYHLTSAEITALTETQQFMSLGIFEIVSDTGVYADSEVDVSTDFQVWDVFTSEVASGRVNAYYEGRLETGQTQISNIKIPVKRGATGSAQYWIKVYTEANGDTDQWSTNPGLSTPGTSRSLVTVTGTDLTNQPASEKRYIVKVEAYVDDGEVLYIGRPFVYAV